MSTELIANAESGDEVVKMKLFPVPSETLSMIPPFFLTLIQRIQAISPDKQLDCITSQFAGSCMAFLIGAVCAYEHVASTLDMKDGTDTIIKICKYLMVQ